MDIKHWKDIYDSKVVTAREAISYVKSGDRIVTGHAAGEPTYLIDTLVENYEMYENVEICHLVSIGEGKYTRPEMKGHFIFNGFFLGAGNRKAVEEGYANYSPGFFHEVPKLLKEELPVDVALVMVSAPDKHGFCSFGTSSDYTKPVADSAKIVIAQVNEYMPRTFGENLIHVRDIDFIVEHSEPILEMQPANVGILENKIGKYCSTLIKDGDCLQLGIGSIPESVLRFLWDRRDLGLHTEMASDGIIDLMLEGVINNKKKQVEPGRSVITFVMGTRRLYDFIDDNPEISMNPVNYVNDPVVIAKNDNVVSINSCIQVDLMGQVASESIGLTQFSGVGGQVDFVRGAAMSKGGRSIIAMLSTARHGTVSRIVPFLDKGAAVTTSRNDVHYVITEYGIALLKGKTLKERARALIKISHPKFRKELKEEFERRFHEPYDVNSAIEKVNRAADAVKEAEMTEE